VLEAIAAHHLGARVLGLSLVTNLAAGLSPQPVNADEVLEIGRASASELGRLLVEFLTQPGVTAELA
ncbi:purine nucleoside phosphorylase, partial [mine drainage metagenome]